MALVLEDVNVKDGLFGGGAVAWKLTESDQVPWPSELIAAI
jgi:hypothetical protein